MSLQGAAYRAFVSYQRDHVHVDTPCGPLTEVFGGESVSPSIALVDNILTTEPHYHLGFDETYFVLDGVIGVRLFDPETETSVTVRLGKHEACFIPRGVHHQVVCSAPRNLLCVLTVPRFSRGDEHPSDASGWEAPKSFIACTDA